MYKRHERRGTPTSSLTVFLVITVGFLLFALGSAGTDLNLVGWGVLGFAALLLAAVGAIGYSAWAGRSNAARRPVRQQAFTRP